LVFGFLKWVPMVFWAMLFLLHHLVGFVKLVPAVAGYFEGTQECRVWGFFPVFCKDVGPHWFLYWVDAGAKGLLLCVGAVGMALRVLPWEYAHPLLDLHRFSLRKFAVPLLVAEWLVPRWVGEVLFPIHLVCAFVMVNVEMTRKGVVIFVFATIITQVSRVPVYLVLWGLVALYEAMEVSQGSRYSDAKDRDVQFLGNWLADLFGRVELKKSVCKEIDFVLSMSTTDDAWKKVRVYAYAGDKLAYYYNGIIGLENDLEVAHIQNKGRLFDDDVLKRAMQYYASRWWKDQPTSMTGKPAATVLEAVSFLVLSGLDDVNSLAAAKSYMAALERVNSFFDKLTAEFDSGRSESLESLERFEECSNAL